VFKQSARYLTLALTLVALTATVRPAHAQSDDPCTDPTTPCVVGGVDPQPNVMTRPTAPQTTAASNTTDDSQSMDDLISYLIFLYGLA
jgi:hypothetical protein